MTLVERESKTGFSFAFFFFPCYLSNFREKKISVRVSGPYVSTYVFVFFCFFARFFRAGVVQPQGEGGARRRSKKSREQKQKRSEGKKRAGGNRCSTLTIRFPESASPTTITTPPAPLSTPPDLGARAPPEKTRKREAPSLFSPITLRGSRQPKTS